MTSIRDWGIRITGWMTFIRNWGGRIADFTIWLLLLAVGIECNLSEVQARRYSHPGDALPSIDLQDYRNAAAGVRTVITDYVQDARKQATARLDRAEAKLRGLLGLSGIVLALVAGFTLEGGWWKALAATSLVFSVLVALRGLGIHTFTSVSISSSEVTAGGADEISFEWQVANDALKATNANEAVTDLIVDCVKASLRWFVLAMLFALCSRLASPNHSPSQDCLKALNTDPQLQKLLRGAEGKQGERGPMGLQGARGPAGEACHPPAIATPTTPATQPNASVRPR